MSTSAVITLVNVAIITVAIVITIINVNSARRIRTLMTPPTDTRFRDEALHQKLVVVAAQAIDDWQDETHWWGDNLPSEHIAEAVLDALRV